MTLINSINHQKPFDLLSHLNEHHLVVYVCIGEHEFLDLVTSLCHVISFSWCITDGDQCKSCCLAFFRKLVKEND